MKTADVIVIGAGVVGSLFARECQRRGAKTVVIDDAGPSATRAAAGMLAPSFETLHHRTTPALCDLLRRALAAWDDLEAEFEEEDLSSAGYDRSGILAIGPLAEKLDGVHPALVPPGLRADRAVMVPGEGRIDPPRLLSLLAAHGPTKITAKVQRVRPGGGDSNLVELESGECLEARTVILTTGVGTWDLLPVLPRPKMVRGRAFLVTNHHHLKQVVRSETVYLVPKPGGTLYIGATEEPAAGEPGSLDDLWNEAETWVLGLDRAEIQGQFDGPRPSLGGNAPFIGEVPDLPNVFAAYGHDRNGVLLAPLTARLLGDLVFDGLTPASQPTTAPPASDGRPASTTAARNG